MFSFFQKKQALTPEELAGKLSHIAFIMDGNGRWAKRRGLPRKLGHVEGAKNFRKVIRHCGNIGIQAITVYAFSTENWQRPEEEVSALMKLFGEYIEMGFEKSKEENIRVIFLGNKERYPEALRKEAERLEEKSKDGKLILNIAINYGGRDEIVHAANAAVKDGKSSLTEDDISAHLYTSVSGDPDLIVRTGGDMRISNFLLWQAAYAELYFTKTLWPDLSAKEIDEIVRTFLGRNRRFGKVE